MNYVCACTCDGAWNRDAVKMILPAKLKCHNGMEEIFFHVCHFPVKKMVSGHDYPFLSSGIRPPLLFFLKGGKASLKV